MTNANSNAANQPLVNLLGAVPTFRKGDVVQFTMTGGVTITGTVTRRNPKTCTIEVPKGTYRVPHRLLTVGDAANVEAIERPAAPTSSFAKGDAVEFDTKDDGVVTGRVIRRSAKTCTIACGRLEWRVAHQFLRPGTIAEVVTPQAVKGLTLGKLRREGTGMEGPRWSRAFCLDRNGAVSKGTIHDDGDGGGLRVNALSGKGRESHDVERALATACKDALVEAYDGDWDGYEAIGLVIEWMESHRPAGVSLKTYSTLDF